MKKFKYLSITLTILMTLLVLGCVTQNPAPITEGSNNVSSTELQSLAEPYHPNTGSTTMVDSGNNNSSNATYVPSYAPVDINARQHTVVKGDTVYNISKRYHISQDELKRWNNIVNHVISVGQVLYVKNPDKSLAGEQSQSQSEVDNSLQLNSGSDKTSQILGANSNKDLSRTVDGVTWIKPAQGILATRFSQAIKGIEIKGQMNSPILAASDGKVIYSSTLDGYGNLIIIQHNSKYLTAYGNNKANLVREGDIVKRGQKIAIMGNSEASRVQLHFELRKDGQAVDPLNYIPAY